MTVDLDIRNYYEQLVDAALSKAALPDQSIDFRSDVTCLALNQLPPKYIRHEVDMAFYLPTAERLEMEMRTEEAVARAIRFLQDRASQKTGVEDEAAAG